MGTTWKKYLGMLCVLATLVAVGAIAADITYKDNPHKFRAPLYTGSVAYTNTAAALVLPSTGDLITVAQTVDGGVDAVTSIAGGVAGRCVRLIFTGVTTMTDGSNLKMAGNLATTGDDTLTLCSNGTNWYEMARSVN